MSEVNINWLATGKGPMRGDVIAKAAGVSIDEELLEAAIDLSDEILKQVGKKATSKQRTQLIITLYELGLESEDHKIDRSKGLRLVKLLAA